MCSQVILAYASHLACTQSTLDLVPAFLCHLRLPDRRELVNTMLSTALAAGVDEPYVREINGQLCWWLLAVGVGAYAGGSKCAAAPLFLRTKGLVPSWLREV